MVQPKQKQKQKQTTQPTTVEPTEIFQTTSPFPIGGTWGHHLREAGESLGQEPLSGPDGQWEDPGAASQLQAGLLPEVPRTAPLDRLRFFIV